MRGLKFAILFLCLPLGNALAASGAAAQPAGAALDLSGYKMTFDDEFHRLSLSARGPGSVWVTHTPWHGDFGAARFADPGEGHVFKAGPHGLTITAEKDGNGKWRSGLICSVDRDGDPRAGFTQKYGYFEMKARLPGGMGTWPAFWLIGTDKSKAAAEIDVIEYYGGFPRYFHSTEHVWVNGANRLLRARLVEVPHAALTRRYNLFGVLITPDTTSFYLNRHEYWSTPTPPEYRQPMYILADLALGGGWPITGLKPPVEMHIEYIRAYQRRAPW